MLPPFGGASYNGGGAYGYYGRPLGSGAAYGWGGRGAANAAYWGGRSEMRQAMSARTQVRTQLRAAGATQVQGILGQLRKVQTQIRTEMTQKYQVEFYALLVLSLAGHRDKRHRDDVLAARCRPLIIGRL